MRENLFDKIYAKADRQNDRTVWGTRPDNLTVTAARHLRGKSNVLDLGTGEGKDAIWLAKKGFRVTGVDNSSRGLKRLRANAKAAKVKLTVKKRPVEQFMFPKDYDCVLSLSTLHFLNRKNMHVVVKRMKAHTTNGGLNIIKVFTENNPGKRKSGRIYFKRNELRTLYKDWEIAHYREYLSQWEKHTKDDTLHRHGYAEIIARRNSSALASTRI